MSDVTRAVSEYIHEKGISISTVSEKTGISYGMLRPSLCAKGNRPLRADEYLKICNFLEVDPLRFFSSGASGRTLKA